MKVMTRRLPGGPVPSSRTVDASRQKGWNDAWDYTEKASTGRNAPPAVHGPKTPFRSMKGSCATYKNNFLVRIKEIN